MSSYLFGTHAANIIHQHATCMTTQTLTTSPPGLFLYISWQAPHSPIQPPPNEVARNIHLPIGSRRRKFAGLVSSVDTGIGMVVKALKETNMWKDTLFVFLSDNGGDVTHASSNYPLRGSKSSMYEGGMRSVAFLSGGLIPLKNRGSSYQGMLSVIDILPTTLSAIIGAHLDVNENVNENENGNENGNGNNKKLDGIDMWSTILQNKKSPRDGNVPTLLGYDPIERWVCRASGGNMMCPGQALKFGNYKLIIGKAGRGDWLTKDSSNMYDTEGWYTEPDLTKYDDPCIEPGDGGQVEYQRAYLTGNKSLADEAYRHLRTSPRLFNIVLDPEERNDLSANMPEILKEGMKILKDFEKQAVPHHRNPTKEEVLRARSRRLVGSNKFVLDVWEPMNVGGSIGV